MIDPKTFTPIRGMIECAAGGSYVSAKDYDKQRQRILALEAALRGVRGLLDDGLWESADRREDVRDWVEVVDALLHDKEKT